MDRCQWRCDHCDKLMDDPTVCCKTSAAQSDERAAFDKLLQSLGKVLEGWTLPDGVRKQLETAYWQARATAPQATVKGDERAEILALARHHAIDHEHWSEDRVVAFVNDIAARAAVSQVTVKGDGPVAWQQRFYGGSWEECSAESARHVEGCDGFEVRALYARAAAPQSGETLTNGDIEAIWITHYQGDDLQHAIKFARALLKVASQRGNP